MSNKQSNPQTVNEMSDAEKQEALQDLLSRHPNLHPSKRFKFDYSNIEELFIQDANPGAIAGYLMDLQYFFTMLLVDSDTEQLIDHRHAQDALYYLHMVADIFSEIERSKISLS